jgi:anti-sigma B factor antagonist
MSFKYKIDSSNNYLHISLSGSLLEKQEADNLIEKLNVLLFENKLFFVFNLEDMNFINSTGLNILINMLTKIRNSGGDMAIYNIPKKIKQVLLITKLNSIFNVSQTIGEAENNIANSIKQHQTIKL